jgi:NAD(P)-dependent dehydrogenase (short-subunit alcohol dehydrogenase family)
VRGSALVTGAGKRIGRVIALELARAGFDIVAHHGRSRDEAQSLVDEVKAYGQRAVSLGADLTDDGDVETLVPRAVEALGPLSLLVNNASVFHDDRIDTLTAESWDAHLKTNLETPVRLAQAFAAQVSEKGARDGALIVNILDQRVWKPTPQFFSYSISKAGLWFATRTLAQALAPRVRVNGVGPGPTLPSIHQGAEDFAAEARNTPLARHATPQEIAHAVLYLVDAPSVTGQMIAVDGGQHLGWRTPDVVEP